MRELRILWYGLYGMIICPWGIVLCVSGVLTARHLVDRFVLAILAVAMFFVGRSSLRKMRKNLGGNHDRRNGKNNDSSAR